MRRPIHRFRLRYGFVLQSLNGSSFRFNIIILSAHVCPKDRARKEFKKSFPGDSMDTGTITGLFRRFGLKRTVIRALARCFGNHSNALAYTEDAAC